MKQTRYGLNFIKIDVPVNSAESGTISEVFFKEGDTVTVGSDLYKIEVGENNNAVAPAEASKVPEAPAVTQAPPAVSVATQPTSHHKRIPLIKFLGPRNFKNFKKQTDNEPVILNTPLFYTIDQLPKRFQMIPFSQEEMDAIDSGCADYRI